MKSTAYNRVTQKLVFRYLTHVIAEIKLLGNYPKFVAMMMMMMMMMMIGLRFEVWYSIYSTTRNIIVNIAVVACILH
jgi:hypothetical protein